MTSIDDGPNSALRILNNGEFEWAQGVANCQEHAFAWRTRNEYESLMVQDQLSQNAETSMQKIHTARPSKEFIRSRITMSHSPWCGRFIEEHCSLCIRHNPTSAQFREAIPRIGLIDSGTRVSSFKK